MFKIIKESGFMLFLLISFGVLLINDVVAVIFAYREIRENFLWNLSFWGVLIGVISIFYHYKGKDVRDYNIQFGDGGYFAGFLGAEELDRCSGARVSRINHRKKIFSKIKALSQSGRSPKCLCLSGNSGSGKTVLISLIKKDLVKNGYKVFINNSYHNSRQFIKNNNDQPTVYIFDQFERSLSCNSFEKWLESFGKDFKNTIFIFSFIRENIAHVEKKLLNADSRFIIDHYHLDLDEDDIKDYISKIANLVSDNKMNYDKIVEKWKNNDFTSGEHYSVNILLKKLKEVAKGEASLIEMEFLGSSIEYLHLNNEEMSNDNYIDIYFDKWVSKFNRKETAFAILNLFTEYKAYSLEDIKLITFEKENEFIDDPSGNIFKALSCASFLSLQGVGNGRFIPKHEYITKVIRKYLAAKEIPAGVKQHTEYYKRSSADMKYIELIQKNYKGRYCSRIPMNICFIIMIAVIYIIYLFSSFDPSFTDENYYQRISTTIIAVPSMMYIYNYCDKIIFCRGRLRALPTYLTSAAMVVVSYLYPDLWAAALGVEIIILSLNILLSICTSVTGAAFGVFIKDSVVFCLIGLLVAAIGVVYNLYFGAAAETSVIFYVLKYSYYLVFFLYTVISCTSHIKSSYYMGRTGYLNMVKYRKK